jgi:hypothetical protein
MVGKAIQNYGTIEYLANDIIANLINDPIVHSHLISQSISKRLDIMFSLLQSPRPISWCKSSGEAGSVGWERSLQ